MAELDDVAYGTTGYRNDMGKARLTIAKWQINQSYTVHHDMQDI